MTVTLSFFVFFMVSYTIKCKSKKVEAHINPWYNCNNHKTKNQGGFI